MAVRKEEAKKYFYLSFIVAMFYVIKKLRSFSVAKLWDKFSLPQISVSRIQMSSLLWCKCSDNIEVNATLFQYFLLDQNHVWCARGDEKQTHICIMTKTPFPLSYSLSINSIKIHFWNFYWDNSWNIFDAFSNKFQLVKTSWLAGWRVQNISSNKFQLRLKRFLNF